VSYDPVMSSTAEPPQRGVVLDDESRAWLDRLHADGLVRDRAVADLHALLLRVARHEVGRRSRMLSLGSGIELDDLAVQAADDAVVAILGKLDDYRGASRFSTWAYTFAVFSVANKVARHAWHRSPPVSDDDGVWARLEDRAGGTADEHITRRAQLDVLRAAVRRDLSERQRLVFTSVALNDVPIDVVALELDANRNAVYKTLFDARRILRTSLATAGYPLDGEP
jgi:RNA polymerase sigma-70 factor (ECF subfamily)